MPESVALRLSVVPAGRIGAEAAAWVAAAPDSRTGPRAVAAASGDGRQLAVAYGSHIIPGALQSPGGGSGGVLKARARVGARELRLRQCDGVASALAWVRCGSDSLLVVGTTAGAAVVCSSRGAALHVQRLRPSAVVRVHPCRAPGLADPLAEEVGLLHADGTLSVISAAGLGQLATAPLCDSPLAASEAPEDDDPPVDLGPGLPPGVAAPPLPTWSAAAALSGGMAYDAFGLVPSAAGVFAVPASASGGPHIADFAAVERYREPALHVYGSTRVRRFITTGAQPTLAAFTAAADAAAAPSARRIAGSAARKMAGMAFGLVRSTLRWSDPAAQPDAGDGDHSPGGHAQRRPSCTPVTQLRPQQTFHDPGRSGAAITVDPSGRFAAVTDNLGRVSVADTAAFVIFRMLKGCRDAQARWLCATTHAEPPRAPAPPGQRVLLCVYLPRRGVLELWRPAQPQRVAAARVGHGCTLLGGGGAPCYLVRPDGEVASVSAEPAAAAARDSPPLPSEDDRRVAAFREACEGGAGAGELCERLRELRRPCDLWRCVRLPEELRPAEQGLQGCAAAARLCHDLTAAGLALAETMGGRSDPGVDSALHQGESSDEDSSASLDTSATPCEAHRLLLNRLGALRAYCLLTEPPPRRTAPGSPVSGSPPPPAPPPPQGQWREVLERVAGMAAAAVAGDGEEAPEELRWARAEAVLSSPDRGEQPMPPPAFLRLLRLQGRSCAVRGWALHGEPAGRLAALFCAHLFQAQGAQDAEGAARVMLRAAHCLSLPPAALLALLVRGGCAAGPAALLALPPDAVGCVAAGGAQDAAAAAEALSWAASRRELRGAALAVAAAAARPESDSASAQGAARLYAALCAARRLKDCAAGCAQGGQQEGQPSRDWVDRFPLGPLASGLSPVALLAAAAAPEQAAAADPDAAADPAVAAYLQPRGWGLLYEAHAAAVLAAVHSACVWPSWARDPPGRCAGWADVVLAAAQAVRAAHPDTASAYWGRCHAAAVAHAVRAAKQAQQAPSARTHSVALACALCVARAAAAPVAAAIAAAQGKSSGATAAVGCRLRVARDGLPTFADVVAADERHGRLKVSYDGGGAEWISRDSSRFASSGPREVLPKDDLRAMCDQARRAIRCMEHFEATARSCAAALAADLAGEDEADAGTDAERLLRAAPAPAPDAEWWAAAQPADRLLHGACEEVAQCGGSGGLEAAAECAGEARAVLRFAEAALGAAEGSAQGLRAVHWARLFPPRALRFLLGGAKPSNGTDDPSARAKWREEAVACILRQGADFDPSMQLAERVADLFGLRMDGGRTVRSVAVWRALLSGDDARAEALAVDADPVQVRAAQTQVVRLRVKHLFVAVTGARSQRRAEANLNLLSAMPLELQQWIDVPAPDEDDEQVRAYVASMPLPTVALHLRVLANRLADRISPGDADLCRVHETQRFVAHLARNL
eukprot:TRINITY_DN8107_c2_g1_i1.p1 TRINITY_DN8107_c2_g1~~TRINITY_DN8107_c2_g1_i1.p1  ORF type:complete len:1451 (+),score=431.67 TRINITY_DN8107_c2_g1_i1:86-4438(+)